MEGRFNPQITEIYTEEVESQEEVESPKLKVESEDAFQNLTETGTGWLLSLLTFDFRLSTLFFSTLDFFVQSA